jgi:TldD protein
MNTAAHVSASYHELRQHELRKTRIVMIDGSLTENRRMVDAGSSARVREGGYWGFASSSGPAASGQARGAANAQLQNLRDQALGHARTLARFGPRDERPLPQGHWRGEHGNGPHASISAGEVTEQLRALTAWCRLTYPGVRSLRLMAMDEQHSKHISTSTGTEALATIRRGMLYLILATEDVHGAPIEVWERIALKGSLADVPLSPEALAPRMAVMHDHLQAKRHAVAARAGEQTVVLAPELTGILAHEAMGHPCEADLVQSGAVTGPLLHQRVASELVSMTDIAHTYEGSEVMMPVYVDDEGTPAVDAPLIERGVLTGYMHSRESAAQMGMAPTGSARAYLPCDEPLVRMRNTVILPGSSTPKQMIEGVEDGYWIVGTGNGQADSTTEFMFGVTLGYEIKNGKVGRAIRDTTLSGSALKVLSQVDAVGKDMDWFSMGYCGKKQPMVVSMGGPSLRTRAQMGGNNNAQGGQ